ncbi:TonB-dependent siderophore receptor [Luteimonas vadosa]|uniref:TonB-dependent siderophore receptor n=1 Tax=Luteimonas vadosa TaxID=1165507 RepID=A0ABP9DVY5_9GAMM
MSKKTCKTTPLAGALSLALTLPALAATPPEIPGDAAPPVVVVAQATDLDSIEVRARRQRYEAERTRTATKTDTPLRDVPQAITVVTEEFMRDQAMASMTDVAAYVPGVGLSQGEGNRDALVFRGNNSTADMFVDGMRDDVQYVRDLYNIQRVEVLKGPNAMIFGRGGSGGLVNRVTKVADWGNYRELGLQFDSHGRRRGTADFGQAIGDGAALRVTAMREDSDSFRDGVTVERHGINPTLSLRPGDATTLTLGYERFQDRRVADRGVPSLGGRPLDTDRSTFFGDPANSPVRADVDAFTAVIEHDFGDGLSLQNRTRFARYEKFYQNVYPGAAARADGSGTLVVPLRAYNNATDRDNLFNQTDLVWVRDSGTVRHTLLAGAEFGRQKTDNFRQTGSFPLNDCNGGPTTSAYCVPVSNPRYAGPVSFGQSATDADNHGVAKIAAVYVQDQVEFSPKWQAILGLRYDRFEIDFRNNRTGETFDVVDDLVSPRAGLVYKPIEPLSLYASYSVSFLPRSGDQLSSLNASNAAFEPEDFRNYEVGAKWDASPSLAFTAAAYRLDRSNVIAPDPTDPARSILVDGQRVRGVELGLAGRVTDAWQVLGGFAWQDGSLPGSSAEPAQLPSATASLWNRYDINRTWGLGLGVIHRADMFASTSNAVRLDGFTRYDAAVYYVPNDNLQLQLNLENLLDEDYFVSAHNDNNLSPGAPRSASLTLRLKF